MMSQLEWKSVRRKFAYAKKTISKVQKLDKATLKRCRDFADLSWSSRSLSAGKKDQFRKLPRRFNLWRIL